MLTFAYAHCETMCPVIVQTVRRAAETLGPEAASTVVVTLDPWRDTPRSLPGLHESWHLDRLRDAQVLSGPVTAVTAVHEDYNVGAVRDTSNGEISHPALVYVLDARGRIAYRFNNPPAAWIVDAVRRLRWQDEAQAMR